VAAAFGMIGPPFVIILILGYLYRQFGASPMAHAILAGLAAVGVGMTLSIGVKLARKVSKPIPVAIAVALFVTVGVLHWPMLPMVLGLTPISIGLEHMQARKRVS
jgi:chromate transporter